MENTRDRLLSLICHVGVDFDSRLNNINAVLVGRGSVLDSLSFVSFIVAVEQRISDAFDQKITLANNRAFSQTQNPFETVSSLASYIEELIDG